MQDINIPNAQWAAEISNWIYSQLAEQRISRGPDSTIRQCDYDNLAEKLAQQLVAANPGCDFTSLYAPGAVPRCVLDVASVHPVVHCYQPGHPPQEH